MMLYVGAYQLRGQVALVDGQGVAVPPEGPEVDGEQGEGQQQQQEREQEQEQEEQQAALAATKREHML